jgi:hypothetical protein
LMARKYGALHQMGRFLGAGDDLDGAIKIDVKRMNI